MRPQDEPIARATVDERTQPLCEHLAAVAELAAQFGAELGCSEWARLAGLWHDLGKYSAEFQQYIRQTSGSENEAGAGPGRVDHSTLGALVAIQRLGLLGRILAYAIAGHHTGLPDWQSEFSGVAGLAQRLVKRIPQAQPPAEIVSHSTWRPRPSSKAAPRRSWPSEIANSPRPGNDDDSVVSKTKTVLTSRKEAHGIGRPVKRTRALLASNPPGIAGRVTETRPGERRSSPSPLF